MEDVRKTSKRTPVSPYNCLNPPLGAADEPSVVPDKPMTKSKGITDPNHYAKVMLLPLTHRVTLFKKRNYRVRCLVGVKYTVMHTVRSVLDMRTRLNLVSVDNIQPKGRIQIRPYGESGLFDPRRRQS